MHIKNFSDFFFFCFCFKSIIDGEGDKESFFLSLSPCKLTLLEALKHHLRDKEFAPNTSLSLYTTDSLSIPRLLLRTVVVWPLKIAQYGVVNNTKPTKSIDHLLWLTSLL